jgi:hypothetical protein
VIFVTDKPTDWRALCAELVDGWVEGCDIAAPMARARAELAQPEPVPVSERPWERDGWCDAEGMCWWGHLRRFQPENRIVHSWGLAAPGRLDASTVCLPHWALPIPTSQEDYD